MRVLIVEDEKLARDNLVAILEEVKSSDIHIAAQADSVESAVAILKKETFDLIFLDIELSDGNSFEIFDQIELSTPVIFSTAYDEYAIEAFQLNSVDYILKPISKDSIEKAIVKYNSIFGRNKEMPLSNIQQLIEQLNKKESAKRHCFLIRKKDKMIPIAVDDFSLFYIEDKVTKGICFDGQEYILDENLDDVLSSVREVDYFRVNRQFIINRKVVESVSYYFAGKLLVHLHIKSKLKITVSKARVAEFKKWLRGD